MYSCRFFHLKLLSFSFYVINAPFPAWCHYYNLTVKFTHPCWKNETPMNPFRTWVCWAYLGGSQDFMSVVHSMMLPPPCFPLVFGFKFQLTDWLEQTVWFHHTFTHSATKFLGFLFCGAGGASSFFQSHPLFYKHGACRMVWLPYRTQLVLWEVPESQLLHNLSNNQLYALCYRIYTKNPSRTAEPNF